MNLDKNNRLHPRVLLPGLCHAVTITAVGYPFDTVKTRLQAKAYPNAYRCIQETFRTEGIRGFYRGAGAPLFSHMVKRPYQFPLFDYLTQGPLELNRYQAGAIAGASGSLVGTPLQMIKVNSQVTDSGSTFRWVADRLRNRGITSFYQGFRITLLKDMLFGGTFLGTYDYLKTVRLPFNGQPISIPIFMCGAMAHSLTWLCLMPVDYMKTSLQDSSRSLTFFRVLKETPIRRYWRGILPMCLRTIPVSGLGMMSYEYVKKRVNS